MMAQTVSKQEKQGRWPDGPGSFSRLLEAAIACADADTDEAYEVARRRLGMAAIAYANRHDGKHR